MKRQLTVIIEREGDGYVSLFPELDIASQGSRFRKPKRIFGKQWSYSLSAPHRKKLKRISVSVGKLAQFARRPVASRSGCHDNPTGQ